MRSRILLMACGLAAALAIGELAARIACACLHRDPVVRADPVIGWVGRAGMKNTLKRFWGGSYRFSTDARGRRVVAEPGWRPAHPGPGLLLLGDSFIQGSGVEDAETLGWRLAHDLGRPVANLGVIGYGTDQELIALEEFLRTEPSTRIDEIVVLVFDNDVSDVQRSVEPHLARTKPRFRVQGGALVCEPYIPSWTDRFMDVSRLFWLVRSRLAAMRFPADPPSGPGLDIIVSCLKQMESLARETGAHLHVLAYHRLRGISPVGAADWARFLNVSGAFDLTARLEGPGQEDLIGPDGIHWSARGHRRVASIVEDLLAGCRGRETSAERPAR